MKRKLWVISFLLITAATLGMECWAAWDGDADTVPWTELIVSYVSPEVAAAVFGALILWLPLHFGVRYLRKRRKS